MGTRHVGVVATVILIATAAFAAKDVTTVKVVLDQVGYLPTDSKIALVETNRDLPAVGAVARVLVQPGGTPALPDIALAVDRKRFGKFRHTYEVDFSALTASGTYVIEIRDGGNLLVTTSPPTAITADPFVALVPGTLRFFGVQRSGNTAPLIHAPSHLDDGVAAGGPQDGAAVDVAGGWYDAGDYISGPRPAYYGLGANTAGKAAAALALGSEEWAADDPIFAAQCLSAAQEIYALGKSITDGTSTDPKHALLVSCVETPQEYSQNQLNCGFYQEDSWLDDMTLAAAELYEASGTPQYLADALTFGQQLEAAFASLGLLSLHDVALFEVYPHAPTSGSGLTQASVLAQLQIDADRVRTRAAANRYNVAQKKFLWGSAADIAGDAVTCVLFSKLTGDAACTQAARWQLDFLFGRNPFGVSLQAGTGSLYPLNPHHQVAKLLPAAWYAPGNVVGSLAGGLAKKSQYPFSGDPDLKAAVLGDTTGPFAPFQNGRFQYHDIHADYVSNEPALDSNSNLLAALLAVAQ